MFNLNYGIWQHLNKRMSDIEKRSKVRIGDTLRYKIWKFLSKGLLKSNLIEDNSRRIKEIKRILHANCHPEEMLIQIKDLEKKFALLPQKPESKPAVLPTPTDDITHKYQYFIACQGFFYSGSSTLIGFFREFDNTSIIGYPDYVYSGTKVEDCGKEVRFFKDSHLFRFIDAFYNENQLEQDAVIKNFINDIYTCYNRKGLYSWDKNPKIYNDKFFKKSMDLLIATLDLDDYTINFMKDKKYPTSWNSADPQFQGCCFMLNEDIKQYVFYKFKKLSSEVFEAYIADYISSFFDVISSKEFLICDQIFGHKYLDRYNKYARIPAKQICIYRDPRDQFISALRTDSKIMPRNIDAFVKFYKNSYGLEEMLKNPNPNRLLIKFEDFVLKYEETAKQIMDFVGIDPRHQIEKNKIFDPTISAVNIGAYKDFIDQDFIKQIEERLSEYCYNI